MPTTTDPRPEVDADAHAATRPRTGPDEPIPYRMTLDVYDRIVAAGAFGDSSPIFLWKGQLVLPMTKGHDHENSAAALMAALVRLIPPGFHLRAGSPVRIPEDSEPEPDLLVVRGDIRDFKARHPGPIDVPLVVEVADSSLGFDTRSKLEAYAAAGIPVYWVVNLPRRRVDVYSGPGGPSGAPGYAELRSYAPGESAPVVLDGREAGRVAVDDILF